MCAQYKELAYDLFKAQGDLLVEEKPDLTSIYMGFHLMNINKDTAIHRQQNLECVEQVKLSITR